GFEVDPRVELAAIVRRLALGSEAADPEYAALVDGRFAAFKDHAAVRAWKELAQKGAEAQGLTTALALELDGFAAPEKPLQDPVSGWPGGLVAEDRFEEALASFARDSGLRGFLAE